MGTLFFLSCNITQKALISSSKDFRKFKYYENNVLSEVTEMVKEALNYDWPKEELPHMRNLFNVKCNDEFFLARVEDYINNLIHNLISPPPFEKETVEA